MHLVHCSDLHLLSLEGARALDFANKRWIGGLNLLVSRGRHHKTEVFEGMIEDFNGGIADHVLVTGDITNLALDEEFRFARELFDRIELGPREVTVLPGNHDAYVQVGARHFARYFEPYFAADDGWEWPDDDPWPIVRIRSGTAIIGVSTSLQTPWFTAYGLIGEHQLGRLREVLTDPRLEGCHRLVAIHHSPAGDRARSRIRGLRDRTGFAELLADTGAELVLHGHEHQDLLTHVEGPAGPIPIRGIQSGTYEAGDGAEDRRARYRIFDISGSSQGKPAVARHWLRVWDPDRGCFSEDGTASVVAAAAPS